MQVVEFSTEIPKLPLRNLQRVLDLDTVFALGLPCFYPGFYPGFTLGRGILPWFYPGICPGRAFYFPGQMHASGASSISQSRRDMNTANEYGNDLNGPVPLWYSPRGSAFLRPRGPGDLAGI